MQNFFYCINNRNVKLSIHKFSKRWIFVQIGLLWILNDLIENLLGQYNLSLLLPRTSSGSCWSSTHSWTTSPSLHPSSPFISTGTGSVSGSSEPWGWWLCLIFFSTLTFSKQAQVSGQDNEEGVSLTDLLTFPVGFW